MIEDIENPKVCSNCKRDMRLQKVTNEVGMWEAWVCKSCGGGQYTDESREEIAKIRAMKGNPDDED